MLNETHIHNDSGVTVDWSNILDEQAIKIVNKCFMLILFNYFFENILSLEQPIIK